MREKRYVRTGIPGVDAMLKGGLYPGSAVLVSGPPGSGKSIFGMQFIRSGAAEFGEPGLFISVEDTAGGLSDYAASLGWDDWERLSASGGISAIGTDYFMSASLSGSLEGLLETVASTKARRMVIDPINLFKYYFPAEEDRRRYMLKFIGILKARGITTLMIAESLEQFPAIRMTEEMYLADGNITLFMSRMDNTVERCFWATKMRRQDINTNIVPMSIGRGGIVVHEGGIPYSLLSSQDPEVG
jgi:KaiC/GvpD/RAD55 family RecA-like ATPase